METVLLVPKKYLPIREVLILQFNYEARNISLVQNYFDAHTEKVKL
jgi:hypothetical protein